jgi:hypothetical protein
VPPIQNLPPNKRTLVRSTATNARAQAGRNRLKRADHKAAIANKKRGVVAAVYHIHTKAVSLV